MPHSEVPLEWGRAVYVFPLEGVCSVWILHRFGEAQSSASLYNLLASEYTNLYQPHSISPQDRLCETEKPHKSLYMTEADVVALIAILRC